MADLESAPVAPQDDSFLAQAFKCPEPHIHKCVMMSNIAEQYAGHSGDCEEELTFAVL
jgi:hypothetical protein